MISFQEALDRLLAAATPIGSSKFRPIEIHNRPLSPRLRVALFCATHQSFEPEASVLLKAIFDSNCFALSALLKKLQCEFHDLGHMPEQPEARHDALRLASNDHDLILSSGGFFGREEEEHFATSFGADGQLDIWKIAIKPGQLLEFGKVRKAWIIGLPKNPVSAMVAFLALVHPFILGLQGIANVFPGSRTLNADFDWNTPNLRTEFLRAQINDNGCVELYPHQGTDIVTSLFWGDGLVQIPPHQEVRKGDLVHFISFAEQFHER